MWGRSSMGRSCKGTFLTSWWALCILLVAKRNCKYHPYQAQKLLPLYSSAAKFTAIRCHYIMCSVSRIRFYTKHWPCWIYLYLWLFLFTWYSWITSNCISICKHTHAYLSLSLSFSLSLSIYIYIYIHISVSRYNCQCSKGCTCIVTGRLQENNQVYSLFSKASLLGYCCK